MRKKQPFRYRRLVGHTTEKTREEPLEDIS
jgi:hypothetical protein